MPTMHTPFRVRPSLRWLALSLSLMGSVACAQTTEPAPADDRLHLSGFGTLALTHNDNPDAGAIFSSAQKRPARKGWSGNLDTALGLQLQWQPLPQTTLIAQGVGRAGNDFDPELRMAFVRQEIGETGAVRVGRLRNPMYFDSDVGEIGYAYQMARPPLPIYGIVNSVPTIDGMDAQWHHTLGGASLLVQGYLGQYDYQHRFYNLNPVQAADAKLRDIGGVALSVALPTVKFRASHTRVGSYTLRSDQVSQLNAGLGQLSGALNMMAANPMLPPGMAQALGQQAGQIQGLTNPFDNRTSYTSLGFDARLGSWQLQGEGTLFDAHSRIVGKYLGYQVTLSRPVGDWSPYVTYARQRRVGARLDSASTFAATGMNPALDAGMAQMQTAMQGAAAFADLSMAAVSLGVRYDFREGMALKVQWDRITTPSTRTPGFFAVSNLPAQRRTNLLTVGLDFVF
jgi:hypothetical protein